MAGKLPVIDAAVAIVPVRDMDASLAFYVELLGFACPYLSRDNAFATVSHGEAKLHLLRTRDEESLKAPAKHISVYIWVRGVDALYVNYGAKLEVLPEGRVRAPFNQPYGMREFHVKDPDGCLLFFGEATVR